MAYSRRCEFIHEVRCCCILLHVKIDYFAIWLGLITIGSISHYTVCQRKMFPMLLLCQQHLDQGWTQILVVECYLCWKSIDSRLEIVLCQYCFKIIDFDWILISSRNLIRHDPDLDIEPPLNTNIYFKHMIWKEQYKRKLV